MKSSRPHFAGPGPGHTLVLALVLAPTIAGHGQSHAADVVYADFEGPGYGDWTTNGTAFGSAPASGAWPGQAAIGGYRGEQLASSGHGGNDATGTLTSPEFVIEQPFIQFLIGGGARAGLTCLNLRVDGRVVRTATGEDDDFMNTATWDVRDLRGRRGRLEVVDHANGVWGHIQVDHLVFAGQAATPPLPAEPVQGPAVSPRQVENPGGKIPSTAPSNAPEKPRTKDPTNSPGAR